MKAIKLFLLVLFASTLSLSAQEFYADNKANTSKSENTVAGDNEKSGDNKIKKNEYKWEFLSGIPSSFDENTIQQAEEHEFGQKVGCLKVLMDKYYVSKEEIVPGDPMMRTIIKKPNIYNTTRKIEKYLKKEVDKGNIALSAATASYIHVLEVAIAIIEEQNAESFENTLDKSKKDISQQIAIFNQVKLNSAY